MIINQSVTDAISNDNTAALFRRAKFEERVIIGLFHTEQEEIHRGYASVELIADFLGHEETPAPHRGRERWTNSEFYSELRRVFPNHEVARHSGLRNTDLMDVIHDALAARNPVVVFHAAETDEGVWEKRYSIVGSVDLTRDRITMNDPHGSFKHLTLAEFIRLTRFEDYEKSFFDILTFAFRRYRLNTVFIIERVPTLREISE